MAGNVYGKYYSRESGKPEPAIHMTEDQWQDAKAKPYESRDTRPFKCDCGCFFFHETFKIDMDGIRINQIQKGEFLFACCKCAKIYEIYIPKVGIGAQIRKVYDPSLKA